MFVSLWIMATLESPETPECRVFREHYNRLVQSIQDPLPLATLLFSEDAIIAVVKEMSVLGLSTLEKNDVLLSAVEKQIRLDPETFHVFVSALNEDPSMQSLVESMQSKSFICGSLNCRIAGNFRRRKLQRSNWWKMFAEKTLANSHKTAKFAKVSPSKVFRYTVPTPNSENKLLLCADVTV